MSGSKFGSTTKVSPCSVTGMWLGVITYLLLPAAARQAERRVALSSSYLRITLEYCRTTRNERDVFKILIAISAKFCNSMFFDRTNIKVGRSNPVQASCMWNSKLWR